MRRFRSAMPSRVPDTTVRGPATAPSIQAQRELARLTAEKIDLIESQMIPGAAGPRTVAPTMPLSTTRTMPPLEIETASVLDRSRAAEPAIEVNASSLPPELEEAAILYANAQPEAAVATLREALAGGGADAVALQAFRMLFDVLTALGARDDFEACAIDFAARFERSPPPWQEDIALADASGSAKSGSTVRFTTRLDAGSARLLEQARRASVAGKKIMLDFGQLTEIDAEGALGLCALFDALEQSESEVFATGAAALHQAARAAIEPERRDASDAIWRAALIALRVLGEQQAFDDLAIDYCVTFELSPPSWEPLPARFRNGDVRAAAQGRAGASRAARRPETQATVNGTRAFALRGELAGLISAELAALREYAQSHSQVFICCKSLVRLDFVAAGELLNELVALAAQGKVALFDRPSAIVEALLNVMGISELAEVRSRPL